MSVEQRADLDTSALWLPSWGFLDLVVASP